MPVSAWGQRPVFHQLCVLCKRGLVRLGSVWYGADRLGKALCGLAGSGKARGQSSVFNERARKMRFRFTLTGQTPLLLHADDVEKADQLQEWRKDSENRDISVKGDDRSPPWTWHTYCYHDGKHLTVPSDNLMVSLREGAKEIILKGQKTFKSLSQSGLLLHDLQMPILVSGKPIPYK